MEAELELSVSGNCQTIRKQKSCGNRRRNRVRAFFYNHFKKLGFDDHTHEEPKAIYPDRHWLESSGVELECVLEPKNDWTYWKI